MQGKPKLESQRVGSNDGEILDSNIEPYIYDYILYHNPISQGKLSSDNPDAWSTSGGIASHPSITYLSPQSSTTSPHPQPPTPTHHIDNLDAWSTSGRIPSDDYGADAWSTSGAHDRDDKTDHGRSKNNIHPHYINIHPHPSYVHMDKPTLHSAVWTRSQLPTRYIDTADAWSTSGAESPETWASTAETYAYSKAKQNIFSKILNNRAFLGKFLSNFPKFLKLKHAANAHTHASTHTRTQIQPHLLQRR